MYAQNCKIKYLKYFDYRTYPQIPRTFTQSTHTHTQAHAGACRHAHVGVHLLGGQATWNFSPLKRTKNYDENAYE